MTTRAIIAAAAAISAVGMAGEADALTPLSYDASLAEPPPSASPHASLAPSAFERLPDEAYEPNAVLADRRARLQCVPFARRESGVEIYGNANTWWAQARGKYQRAKSPRERAVMVLHGYAGANRGHVAVIREMVSERLLIVDHANWLNTGEITRDVPVRDVSSAGDWSRVQVWNLTTGEWGVRVYNVQGFILAALESGAPEAGEARAAAANPANIPTG